MLNINKFQQNSRYMSRGNLNTIKIVLLTSLFWVFIDAFLIIYLAGDTSRTCVCNCPVLSAQQQVEQQVIAPQEESKLLNNLKLNENYRKFKQEKSTSFQFSSKNDRLKFMDKLKMWFKEEISEATNPASWPGENGKSVVLPNELKAESEKRYKENQFNIVASDLVALNRSLPEQRSAACKNREYPVDLPTTSIIIVYHNEGNSTLLRGLTSIVNRSPLRYLKEIILVDDCSENRDYLHGPLDEFVKTLPVSVKIFRNKERMGLIRSRLVGAEAATGDTMTFLDAHIEATNGWLPPLLTEVKHNRKTIPCPVIDVISDDTFEYLTGSEMTYGGFDSHIVFDWIPVPAREDKRRENDRSKSIRFTIVSPIIDVIKEDDFSYLTGSITTWGGLDYKFTFNWVPIPEREQKRLGYDNSLPARTPTMAGGLFTIDRKFFYELGAYDEGMSVWGAENIEMSLRAWMCGGTLLIVPCSHVGHVFRKQTPYTFPGGTSRVIFGNNRRLIDVWTDEYANYFHKIIPELNNVEAGDLSSRFKLKNDLQCQSFKWYLNNIYPEAPIPIDFYHVGTIKNIELNFCLDTMGRKVNEDVGATYCHGQGGNQIFEYSKDHKLKVGNNCVDASAAAGAVKFGHCVQGARNQQWDYDNQQQQFRNRQTSACLSIDERNNNVVITIICSQESNMQKWELKDSVFQSS